MKMFKGAASFTAAGVIAIAVLGGAVGGTLAMRQGDSVPAGVRLEQVAEEATAAPSAEPSAEPTMVPSAAPSSAPEPSPAPAGDEESGPVATTPTDTETAKEAADRSDKAADRAEDAADRAEEAADTVAAPVAPEPAPAAPKPDCEDGATRPVPYRAQHMGAGVAGEDTCINGKWVRTKEPVDEVIEKETAGPRGPGE